MTCPICKNGNIEKGYTSFFFENDISTIIIKKVPANVCDNCNESFILEGISKRILEIIKNELKKGVQVEVINYAA